MAGNPGSYPISPSSSRHRIRREFRKTTSPSVISFFNRSNRNSSAKRSVFPMASHRKDVLIPLLTVLFDVVAIEGAFLFSYWLRFFSPFTDLFPVELGVPPLEAYVYGSFLVIPVWLFLFHTREMYATRRTIHFSDEFFPIVRVVVIGMLVVMAAAFFYRAFSFSRLVFGLLGFASFAFFSLGGFP